VDIIAGPDSTFSAPAIAVRSTGEADVVWKGANYSLQYAHATPGSPWSVDIIAGPDSTFSAPAIAVRSTGEADVVATNGILDTDSDALMYYWATPGSAWQKTQISDCSSPE
jgi:hypothetical protein